MRVRPIALVAIAALGTTSGLGVGWLVNRIGDDEQQIFRHPEAAVVTAAQFDVSEVPLGTDEMGTVTLDAPDDHDSVLVRISIPAVPGGATIFAQGAPALTLPPDHTGSTTVLVPVVDDTIRLHASTAVGAHIEPLLFSRSDITSPGSTIALAAPVTRADTVHGLAGTILSDSPLWVGLVGQGGVPATGVRAVHATATISVQQATDLVIGDQHYSVPSGATSVTTVIAPDDHGRVPVSVTNGSGSLVLDVRGWLPETTSDSAQANVTGSMVLATDHTPSAVSVGESTRVIKAVRPVSDAAYTLAMVSAPATPGASVLTVQAEGSSGTANTMVVDPTVGAIAQIAVVATAGRPMSAHVDHGRLRAQFTPLASVLGEPTNAADSTLALAVISPRPGASVNLKDGGSIELTGTVNSDGAAIDAVQVAVAGRTVATAALHPMDGGWQWTARTTVPASGTYDFDVTARARDGATLSRTVPVKAIVPDATVNVIAHDVQVPDTERATILALTENSVTYDADPALIPGNVVVSEPTAVATRGLLRRVEAVNQTPEGWTVTTSEAAVTDAVLQTDTEVNNVIDQADQVTVEPADAPGATAAQIVDQGRAPVTLAQAAPRGFGLGPLSVDAGVRKNPGFDVAPYVGIGVDTMLAWYADGSTADLSRADDATRTAALTRIAREGGANIGAQAHVEASMRMVLRITVEWSWFVPKPKVQEYRAVVGTQVSTSINADASMPQQWQAEFPLARISLPPTTVPIGPIPLVISADVDVDLNAALNVTAAGHAQATTQLTGTYGWLYDGTWSKITQDPVLGYGPPAAVFDSTADLNGTFEVKAGPSLAFSMWLYDSAGGEITTAVAPGLKAAFTHDAGTKVDVGLFADVSGQIAVALRIPVLRIKVAQWSVIDVNRRVPVASFSIGDAGRGEAVDNAAPAPRLGTPAPEPDGEPEPTPTS